MFMSILDNTIVNVALTAMERDFQSNINNIQWVVTAYYLAQAATIPIAATSELALASKRLFLMALAVFTVGSLLCGISPISWAPGRRSPPDSIPGASGERGRHALSAGVGAGFWRVPPIERAAASAVISIPVLIAPAFGPTLGGLIVDSSVGWPGIFFLNVPVGVLAMALVQRVVDPDPRRASEAEERRPFDLPGLFLSMVGIVLVVYTFSIVSQTNPRSITLDNPSGDLNGWEDPLVWRC